MYISYEYYRIFYHVARCGNLTKAAEALQNSHTRDSELRGGDRLSTLFAHESGHDFDPGGRGAVPAHKDRLYGN